MHFSDLKLDPVIVAALTKTGYVTPTPIQREAIPHVLTGRDLVAVAQTGTGKTAAFAVPIIDRLHRVGAHRGPGARPIRVLVLAPTRELATQIGDGFQAYGHGTHLTHAVIFGGVGQDAQVKALRRGVDVLVAAPGRLLDLIGQRLVDLRNLEVLVLDEADRMLDMGFILDVKRIIAVLPAKRQTLLFSATMPAEIQELAARFLKDPQRVAVTPPSTTVEKIAQSIYLVDHKQKRALLLHLLRDPKIARALVFTRTKHGANRVAESLEKSGVPAAAIHGNKSQNARERALDGFKRGTLRVLVATDIAARGIDVDGVTHVIQVDLPEVPEQYVHRIGRTARAGAEGVAWSFCSSDEKPLLADIERNIRLRIDQVRDHPFTGPAAPEVGGAHDEREPRAHNPRGPRRDQNQRASSGSGRRGATSSARGGAPQGHGQPGQGTGGGGGGGARSTGRSFGPGRRR
jgi:ATP-dependent RNA helicase RhlE